MAALKNIRHEIYAANVAAGKTQTEAALVAGYKEKWARSQASALSTNPDIQARIAEINHEIVTATLVDATKLHRRWSEMFEADIADIMDDHGHYLPVHQWPKVWRQMLSGCDVKELFEHSKDGGGKSWDKIGEVVKLKFVGVKELGELLGKHKAVDAFVQQKQEDHLHLHVHAEITQKLQSALNREQRIIEIKPENTTD